MNQRGISWLLVVVLVTVVLAGAYYLGTRKPLTLQDVVSKQNPVIFPSSSSKESTPSPKVDISNWQTYTNTEGNYSLKYPSNWTFEQPQPGHAGALNIYKGNIMFHNQYSPDSGDYTYGEIKIITLDYLCGTQCQKMTEKDFFDRKNSLWRVGNIGGGGPGTTVDKVYEIEVAGKRAMLRSSHPTKDYESASPNQITYTWYIYLNNQANEVLIIDFTYTTLKATTFSRIDEFYKILSTFKFTN